MIREPVVPDPRKPPTEARKRRVWERENGICWWCDKGVDVTGPRVRYDHKLALDLGGPETDENLFPLHRDPCDLAKTAEDRVLIDKARRLRKKNLPRDQRPEKKGPRLKGRPFEKGRKVQISSRPFPNSKRFR